MKELSNSEKAKMAMDSAIWNHGRLKSYFTIAIKNLKMTGLSDRKEVKDCISFLELEREKLKKKELF